MKKRERGFLTAVGAFLLAAGTVFSIFAMPGKGDGWQPGSPRGWTESGGSWKYLDWDGLPVKDELRTSNHNWYYLDENGEIVRNDWVEMDWGGTCYFDENGVRAADQIREIKGKKYCFDDTGTLVKDEMLYFFDGNLYTISSEGEMAVSQWVRVDDYLGYRDQNGKAYLDGWYQLTGPDGVKGWFDFDVYGNVAREDVGEDQNPWGYVFHLDPDTGRWLESPGDTNPADLKKKPRLTVPDLGVLEVGKTTTVKVTADGNSDIQMLPFDVEEKGLADLEFQGGRLSVTPHRCGYGEFLILAQSEERGRSTGVVVRLEIKPSVEMDAETVELMTERQKSVPMKFGKLQYSWDVATAGQAKKNKKGDNPGFRVEAYAENSEIVDVRYDEATGRVLVKALDAPGDAIAVVTIVDDTGEYEFATRKEFRVVVQENPAVKELEEQSQRQESIRARLDAGLITPNQALEETIPVLRRVKSLLRSSSVYDSRIWEKAGAIEAEAWDVLNEAGVDVDVAGEVETESDHFDNIHVTGLLFNIPTDSLKPGERIRCYLSWKDSERDLKIPAHTEADMDTAVAADIKLHLETGERDQVISVTSPLLIEMDPPAVPGADDSDRQLLAIHYESGKPRIIPSVYDTDSDRYRFAAYGFSTYAFVYGVYDGDIKIPVLKNQSGATGGGNSEQAGKWMKDETGWWYSYPGNLWPSNGWYYLPWNGEYDWYHFNPYGYLDTGWFTDKDGEVYYLHPVSDGKLGSMYLGWNQIKGRWYYFHETGEGRIGALYRSRMTPDGFWVDESGVWVQ